MWSFYGTKRKRILLSCKPIIDFSCSWSAIWKLSKAFESSKFKFAYFNHIESDCKRKKVSNCKAEFWTSWKIAPESAQSPNILHYKAIPLLQSNHRCTAIGFYTFDTISNSHRQIPLVFSVFFPVKKVLIALSIKRNLESLSAENCVSLVGFIGRRLNVW